ncbi:MAG: hypothetical protein IBJ15_17005 [Alphaproteobacteria bacterium]|nr:hypothetical protein [Alphaproteobacteria bacterium]
MKQRLPQPGDIVRYAIADAVIEGRVVALAAGQSDVFDVEPLRFVDAATDQPAGPRIGGRVRIHIDGFLPGFGLATVH